jgi:uncharacterized protein YjiS (DUF1127 family)
MSCDGLDPDAPGFRDLSCRERAALKASCIVRAHEERNRLIRRCVVSAVELLVLLRRGLHELYRVVRMAVRRQLARQKRLAELRQLTAMSDLELNDIGISRSEIRAAMRSGTLWPRYGLRASPDYTATQTTQGENHAEGLLDCSRLGS